jgi:hypothetical protein
MSGPRAHPRDGARDDSVELVARLKDQIQVLADSGLAVGQALLASLWFLRKNTDEYRTRKWRDRRIWRRKGLVA